MRELDRGYISSVQEAQGFRNDAMHQLDNLILGEEQAKLALLAAMASGSNVALVGEPGGGKTTLGMQSHRLVDEFADDLDALAVIPPLADLTPQQLVGGTPKTTKTTEVNGQSTTETTHMHIDPILKPTTRVIFGNEINRVNPFAVNAMLDALEEGVVTNKDGQMELDLAWTVATMNPAENIKDVFPMSAASASRHAIGAVMGNGGQSATPAQLAEFAYTRRNQARREFLDPVIDIKTLQGIGRLADSQAVLSSDSLVKEAAQRSLKVQEVLGSQGVVESIPRIAKHLGRLSRVLTVLSGEDRESKESLDQATRFVISARLGILGTRYAQGQGIAENINTAVEEALAV